MMDPHAHCRDHPKDSANHCITRKHHTCRCAQLPLRSICRASSAAEAPVASDQQRHMSSASGTNGTAAPARAAALTFQEAVARLQEYWASVGCVVWQPFNSEVLITTISAHTDPVYASMLCYVRELYYRQLADIRPFLNPYPVAFEVAFGLKTNGLEHLRDHMLEISIHQPKLHHGSNNIHTSRRKPEMHVM